MSRWIAVTVPTLLTLAFSLEAGAQQNGTAMVAAADGTTYQAVTEIQTREERVLRPQTATEYQTYQQTYMTPVTEYRWVSRLRGAWNPFTPSYWTHNLEPFTRWEQRPATVQMPVARTEWVEEKRTTHVPVTTYRSVGGGTTYASSPAGGTRVQGPAMAARTTVSGSTNVALNSERYGSQMLPNDPPRDGWTGRR